MYKVHRAWHNWTSVMQARCHGYISPPYFLGKMYTVSITCCLLLSHGEHVNATNRWTDRCQTVSSCFLLDKAGIKIMISPWLHTDKHCNAISHIFQHKNLFPESHDTAPYTFRHISYYNFSKDLITDCFLILLHFVNHSILKSVIYQLLFDVA